MTTFDSLLKQQYYCIHNANRLFLVKFTSTVEGKEELIQLEDFTIQLKAGTTYLGGGTTDLNVIPTMSMLWLIDRTQKDKSLLKEVLSDVVKIVEDEYNVKLPQNYEYLQKRLNSANVDFCIWTNGIIRGDDPYSRLKAILDWERWIIRSCFGEGKEYLSSLTKKIHTALEKLRNHDWNFDHYDWVNGCELDSKGFPLRNV